MSSTLQFTFLCLATFRIYLEVIQFDFNKLPISNALSKHHSSKFHRMGFIVSVGYLILFAPEYFFYS